MISRRLRLSPPTLGRVPRVHAPAPAHGLRAPLLVLLAWHAFLAGCSTPREPLLEAPAREKARVVTMTRLEDRSVKPPVTIEQAQRKREVERILQPPAPARELRLTVSEVRKAALENNLDIRVQLVPPAVAGERVSEEEARFEASFIGSASLQTQDLPEVAGVGGGKSRLGDSSLAVQVPLRTGGTAAVHLDAVSTDVGVPGIDTTYDTAGGFSISQPLLRGAGVRVNTAPITVARLQQGQEEARTKLAVMRVLADSESAYWRHYAAGRILEVRYQQYQRAQEQLHNARRLSESGVIPNIEVTRSRAGVARRVDDIIVAETTRRATERELKRIMNVTGMGVGSPTVLLGMTDPVPVGLTFDVDRLAQDAVDRRMEMLELELQLAVDALDLDVARNGELPLVSLDYSFDYLGTSTSLADSLDNLTRRDRRGWSVGASVEVPLGNGAANARRRQAMLQRVLTLTTRDQQAIAIRKEVYDASDQLQEAWQRILAAREETLTATRTYEAEKRQFLAGVRTSTDVLDAADFLAEAQIREISALSEYEIAKVSLAYATGTVLGKGRVRLIPDRPAGSHDAQPYGLKYTPPEASSATEVPDPVLAQVAEIIGKARARAARPEAGEQMGARADPPATAGQYTIQLASGADAAAARRYVDAMAPGAQVEIVETGTREQPRYVVLYGHYASPQEAASALSALPDRLRAHGAFVRSLPPARPGNLTSRPAVGR